MNSQHQITLEKYLVEKKFEDGRNYLEKIKSEISPSTYFYNLGVLYHKEGQVPLARWAFEKSFYEGSVSLKTWHNWSYYAKQSGFKDAESSLSHPLFFNNYGLFSLSILFLVFAFYFFKKKSLKISLGILSIFVVLAGMYGYAIYGSPSIIVEKTNVKEGPSSVLENIGELPAGMRVVVGEEKDGWSFIKLPMSVGGWVQTKSLIRAK